MIEQTGWAEWPSSAPVPIGLELCHTASFVTGLQGETHCLAFVAKLTLHNGSQFNEEAAVSECDSGRGGGRASASAILLGSHIVRHDIFCRTHLEWQRDGRNRQRFKRSSKHLCRRDGQDRAGRSPTDTDSDPDPAPSSPTATSTPVPSLPRTVSHGGQ